MKSTAGTGLGMCGVQFDYLDRAGTPSLSFAKLVSGIGMEVKPMVSVEAIY